MPLDAAAKRATAKYEELIKNSPAPVGSTEEYKGVDDLAYALSQISLFTPRPIKMAVMGSGFSGMSIAHAVSTGRLKNVDLTIYEKNSNVGGTWWENRYPGCACDIPAHNYQFSWAPNPHWASFYANRDNILDYVEAVADQYDLRKYIKTSHKITHAQWVEDNQAWSIQVTKTDGRELVISTPGVTEGETETKFTEEYDIFINAGGYFNNWKWPRNVPGRETFKGRTLHSAIWPKDGLDTIKGKTVALIGNGSSGVQLLPGIINHVDKVFLHLRSKTWVTAGLAQRFAGPNGANLHFSAEQKKHWDDNPAEYLAYRKEVEQEMNVRFRMYIADSDTQKGARKFSESQMREKLEKGGKPELADSLVPDFGVGCRRPTPGNGYLEALCSDKVEVIWDTVESFTETGLRSASGIETHVDTIICATGFDLSFVPRFPIIGRNNVNLQDQWKTLPAAYLSITAANMPNYFNFMGPASPVGHGNMVTSIEFVTHHVVDLINKLQTQNYGSLCPKPDVPGAYQKQALKWLNRTVWPQGCSSTFKAGTKDGKLVSLHPGSRLHYFKLLTTPRYEDFDWTSLCTDPDNQFAFLANGFTEMEDDPSLGADMTYFLNPTELTKHIAPTWETHQTNGA